MASDSVDMDLGLLRAYRARLKRLEPYLNKLDDAYHTVYTQMKPSGRRDKIIEEIRQKKAQAEAEAQFVRGEIWALEQAQQEKQAKPAKPKNPPPPPIAGGGNKPAGLLGKQYNSTLGQEAFLDPTSGDLSSAYGGNKKGTATTVDGSTQLDTQLPPPPAPAPLGQTGLGPSVPVDFADLFGKTPTQLQQEHEQTQTGGAPPTPPPPPGGPPIAGSDGIRVFVVNWPPGFGGGKGRGGPSTGDGGIPPPVDPNDPDAADDEDDGGSSWESWRQRRRKHRRRQKLMQSLEPADAPFDFGTLSGIVGKSREARKRWNILHGALSGDPDSQRAFEYHRRRFFGEHASNVLQGLKGAAEPVSETGAGNVGSFLGAASHFAQLFGPTGKVVGGALKFGEVIFKSAESLTRWTEKLHESNMQFAQFSYAMTQVQVGQELRDIYYGRERGEARAASAQALAEARSYRREMAAPISDAFSNAMNHIGAALETAFGHIMRNISQNSGLAGANPLPPPENPQQVPASSVAFALDSTTDWVSRYGRPNRFRND